MSEKVGQKWRLPKSNIDRNISVFNSLTSKCEKFLTIHKNTINWYGCGPTVYSSAHLGHARAYITFDIIRRILEDFFNYDINYVMNITDIDDKIILRARRTFLLDQYFENLEKKKDFSKAKQDFELAFNHSEKNYLAKISEIELNSQEKLKQHDQETKDILNGEMSKLEALRKTRKAFLDDLSDDNGSLFSRQSKYADILADYLDAEKRAEVTDLTIFKKHSEKFEREFLEDMDSLDIKPPDCLTRVTEFIPEITEYIQKIISNGFGYEANGSVYFDIEKFRDSGRTYPKIRPKQFGNETLLGEGEGALLSTKSDKKSQNDFVLWKKSKAGEPFWESPWGNGRPGWHIECSVMGSSVLGKSFDIHTGGIDLCFPHHDNEIAQAEAYYNLGKDYQWVNYFLHAGHLGINGLKMAKSLKNFITIRQALKHNSGRQIRLCFLLQGWNKHMDYSTSSLQEAVSKEKTILEFLSNVEVFMRKAENKDMSLSNQKWNESDTKFNDTLTKHPNEVFEYLSSNFDYPSAVKSIFDQINATNKYMASSPNSPKYLLIKKSAAAVHKFFRILGVLANDNAFMSKDSNGKGEKKIISILDAFCLLRFEIRSVCLKALKKPDNEAENEIKKAVSKYEKSLEKSGIVREKPTDNTCENDKISKIYSECERFVEEAQKSLTDYSALLKLTDEVRDDRFIFLGVKLEDVSENGRSHCRWKRMEKEFLIRERRERLADAEKKMVEKLESKISAKSAKIVKLTQWSLPLQEKFLQKNMDKTFTFFEENGFPTALMNGEGKSEEMSKKMRKKLEKDLKKFEAEFSKYEKGGKQELEILEMERKSLKDELDKIKSKCH